MDHYSEAFELAKKVIGALEGQDPRRAVVAIDLARIAIGACEDDVSVLTIQADSAVSMLGAGKIGPPPSPEMKEIMRRNSEAVEDLKSPPPPFKVQVLDAENRLAWERSEGGGVACRAFVTNGVQSQIINILRSSIEQAECESVSFQVSDRMANCS